MNNNDFYFTDVRGKKWHHFSYAETQVIKNADGTRDGTFIMPCTHVETCRYAHTVLFSLRHTYDTCRVIFKEEKNE